MSAFAAVPATVGHGLSALWYLTRASGLVSFILLSSTVVLGIVASVGGPPPAGRASCRSRCTGTSPCSASR